MNHPWVCYRLSTILKFWEFWKAKLCYSLTYMFLPSIRQCSKTATSKPSQRVMIFFAVCIVKCKHKLFSLGSYFQMKCLKLGDVFNKRLYQNVIMKPCFVYNTSFYSKVCRAPPRQNHPRVRHILQVIHTALMLISFT